MHRELAWASLASFPDMFLVLRDAYGAPRTDPAASRAPPDLIEKAATEHPGWVESGQILDFQK